MVLPVVLVLDNTPPRVRGFTPKVESRASRPRAIE